MIGIILKTSLWLTKKINCFPNATVKSSKNNGRFRGLWHQETLGQVLWFRTSNQLQNGTNLFQSRPSRCISCFLAARFCDAHGGVIPCRAHRGDQKRSKITFFRTDAVVELSKKVVQSIAKLCLEPKEHSKKITTIIVSSVVDDGLDLKQTKNDSC